MQKISIQNQFIGCLMFIAYVLSYVIFENNYIIREKMKCQIQVFCVVIFIIFSIYNNDCVSAQRGSFCAANGSKFSGEKKCGVACHAVCAQPGCGHYKSCEPMGNDIYRCLCNSWWLLFTKKIVILYDVYLYLCWYFVFFFLNKKYTSTRT